MGSVLWFWNKVFWNTLANVVRSEIAPIIVITKNGVVHGNYGGGLSPAAIAVLC